jgi:hypothetical protein
VQTAEVGRSEPWSQIIPDQRLHSSARLADLPFFVRLVWARIAVVRMIKILAIGEWRCLKCMALSAFSEVSKILVNPSSLGRLIG